MGILFIGIPMTLILLAIGGAFIGWIAASWFGWLIGLIIFVGTVIYTVDKIGWVIPSIVAGLVFLVWLVRRARRFAAEKTAEEAT